MELISKTFVNPMNRLWLTAVEQVKTLKVDHLDIVVTHLDSQIMNTTSFTDEMMNIKMDVKAFPINDDLFLIINDKMCYIGKYNIIKIFAITSNVLFLITRECCMIYYIKENKIINNNNLSKIKYVKYLSSIKKLFVLYENYGFFIKYDKIDNFIKNIDDIILLIRFDKLDDCFFINFSNTHPIYINDIQTIVFYTCNNSMYCSETIYPYRIFGNRIKY